MRQFPPLPFQGGHTASMSLPSGAPPTYADTLSSAVTSNKTKEDQRRQATQTRTARPATDERTAAPKTQRNSTSGGTLPRKRTLADRRIPKKTLRWDKTNVPFLSKLAITFFYLRTGATTSDRITVAIQGITTVGKDGIIQIPRERKERERETIPHP